MERVINAVLDIVEAKRLKHKRNASLSKHQDYKTIESHIAIAMSDLKSELTTKIKYNISDKRGLFYQTKFRADENAMKVGNCFATCIANILHLDIEDVPNVETLFKVSKNGKNGYWFDVFMSWLYSIGYYYDQITEDNPPQKDELYLANGLSERGVMHSVIYKNGELYFDPYPNGKGLEKIEFFSVIRKCEE